MRDYLREHAAFDAGIGCIGALGIWLSLHEHWLWLLLLVAGTVCLRVDSNCRFSRVAELAEKAQAELRRIRGGGKGSP